MVAAQFRDCRLLELLLRRAADPSERDKVRADLITQLALTLVVQYWETALHIAVTCENARAVDLLLANGANADLQNKRCKWTALHIACSQGHFAIAAALIDHGASTKLVDTKKLCALALMADESKRAELEQRGRRADTWRRRRGLVLCYSSLAAPTQASSARVLSTAAVLGCSDLAACVAKYL